MIVVCGVMLSRGLLGSSSEGEKKKEKKKKRHDL
jgi:hypothetical protein